MSAHRPTVGIQKLESLLGLPRFALLEAGDRSPPAVALTGRSEDRFQIPLESVNRQDTDRQNAPLPRMACAMHPELRLVA